MPFWSWVGENLQAVIYGVATALLYPVLALEVVALGIVLVRVRLVHGRVVSAMEGSKAA